MKWLLKTPRNNLDLNTFPPLRTLKGDISFCNAVFYSVIKKAFLPLHRLVCVNIDSTSLSVLYNYYEEKSTS